jgi:hypothetical protein
MIRSRFSGFMNDGNGREPVIAERNRSVSSWLPRNAAKSCGIGGAGGANVASWHVNSYIGLTRRSRLD